MLKFSIKSPQTLIFTSQVKINLEMDTFAQMRSCFQKFHSISNKDTLKCGEMFVPIDKNFYFYQLQQKQHFPLSKRIGTQIFRP